MKLTGQITVVNPLTPTARPPRIGDGQWITVARVPPVGPCESKKVPGDPLFCDVSLPVPLDRAFTYRMPEILRHRVQAGCRVLAPLGTGTLTGLVLKTHADPPQGTAREILRLLDEEPALDEDLLRLGQWIAEFYCAPLGET